MTSMHHIIAISNTCPQCPHRPEDLKRHEHYTAHLGKSRHAPIKSFHKIVDIHRGRAATQTKQREPSTSGDEDTGSVEDSETDFTDEEKMWDHLTKVDSIMAVGDEIAIIEKVIAPYMEDLEMMDGRIYEIWMSLHDEKAKLETVLAWALKDKEATTINLFTFAISTQVIELAKKLGETLNDLEGTTEDEDSASDTTVDTDHESDFSQTSNLVDESLAEMLQDLQIELVKLQKTITAIEELKALWEAGRSQTARAAACGDWLKAASLSEPSSDSEDEEYTRDLCRRCSERLEESTDEGGAKIEVQVEATDDTVEKEIQERIRKLQVEK